MGRRRGPHYPTRAELEAGAEPIEAVPRSLLLRLMRGRIGHKLDLWAVQHLGFSFISWAASRARGISYQPSLVLIARGRRTGRDRPVVLPYVRDGGRLVVVASNAGSPRPPAWVANLVAEPRCAVILDRRRRQAIAAVAEGTERARLMDLVAETRPQVPNYEQHARRHGRRLDLVVLRLV